MAMPAGSNSDRMEHAFIKPNAWSNSKRGSWDRDSFTEKKNTGSAGVEKSGYITESEITQIFQTATEEAMTTIVRIFENAKDKAVASLQRVDIDKVRHSDISHDVGSLPISDSESELPESVESANETLDTSFENTEDDKEALIKGNLDRYELYISDCVKTTDLIAFYGPLSSAQTKKLRKIDKKSPTEASKTALQMIRNMKRQPNKFRLLLKALSDAGYEKVVQILDGTLIPIGSCHRDIIRKCASHIFQRLNTSDILPYLYSKRVISSDDKEQVLKTERTESTGIAALELLDMLPSRNKRWFKYFNESLIESGHKELSQIVKDNTNTTIEKSQMKTRKSVGMKRAQSYNEDAILPKKPKSSLSLDQLNSDVIHTSQLSDALCPPRRRISISGNLCQQDGLLEKQKAKEHLISPSSSQKDDTNEANNAVKSITHGLSLINGPFEKNTTFPLSDGESSDGQSCVNVSRFENQNKLTSSDRILSPTSESSDDQSCVDAFGFDHGFHNICSASGNTICVDESDTHLRGVTDCNSDKLGSSESHDNGSAYPEVSQPATGLNIPRSGGAYLGLARKIDASRISRPLGSIPFHLNIHHTPVFRPWSPLSSSLSKIPKPVPQHVNLRRKGVLDVSKFFRRRIMPRR